MAIATTGIFFSENNTRKYNLDQSTQIKELKFVIKRL